MLVFSLGFEVDMMDVETSGAARAVGLVVGLHLQQHLKQSVTRLRHADEKLQRCHPGTRLQQRQHVL
mgnify:CR=1 FL=1